MCKNDKIHRIMSVCAFILHICIFVFVVLAGLLPYHENENFYECFNGSFGKTLGFLQPILMLAILFVACIFSYLSIKRPHLSLWVGCLTMVFFLLEIWPYSFEIALVSFLSRVGEIGVSTYHIGFKLINLAAYIIYFDIAFFIYSVITLIVRCRVKS